MKQKTISETICCSGVGIHSGEQVELIINPAPANHGIVFIKVDRKGETRIPAICENIKSALNASTVGVNGTRIGTVEHIMAAFSGLTVDNAEIKVYGPEIPILDGSASPFVEMIKKAGIVEVDAPKTWLVVTKPVRVEQDGRYSEIKPSPHPVINCVISYDHPLLDRQEMKVTVSPEDFENDIAPARTFGFLQDVDRLRAMGLAKGGSLENAVILDSEKVINAEGLRWRDEFVRHKVLDIVGDLALAGMPVLGEISAYKTGHGINHLLLQRLLSNPEHFDIIESRDLGLFKARHFSWESMPAAHT